MVGGRVYGLRSRGQKKWAEIKAEGCRPHCERAVGEGAGVWEVRVSF